ncbi:hypothetical protein [Thiothrix nivea]|uniref:hypothetical protein n=1 Tax=Thiothrix nivea TaxID=1031 RepID=UPI00031463A1|nr:hypothetical protein [Thiothrix nivea]
MVGEFHHALEELRPDPAAFRAIVRFDLDALAEASLSAEGICSHTRHRESTMKSLVLLELPKVR